MVVLMTATTITTVYADDRTRHHQPIREKLSIEQGYYTRLGEPTPFGMYRKDVAVCVTLFVLENNARRVFNKPTMD